MAPWSGQAMASEQSNEEAQAMGSTLATVGASDGLGAIHGSNVSNGLGASHGRGASCGLRHGMRRPHHCANLVTCADSPPLRRLCDPGAHPHDDVMRNTSALRIYAVRLSAARVARERGQSAGGPRNDGKTQHADERMRSPPPRRRRQGWASRARRRSGPARPPPTSQWSSRSPSSQPCKSPTSPSPADSPDPRSEESDTHPPRLYLHTRHCGVLSVTWARPWGPTPRPAHDQRRPHGLRLPHGLR